MCTVSFVPDGLNRFILTSNRDETLQRGLATAPRQLNYRETSIVCPQDPLALGSWIALSEKGSLTCLLNGAFKKHQRQLTYRKSRGIVLLDSLTFDSPHDFALHYDFSEIEPFTIVMINCQSTIALFELRWDGDTTHFKQLNEKDFHLWSSVTLYDDELTRQKEATFKEHLAGLTEISSQHLIDFHKNHFLYEEWVKPPQRVPEVATLSVTAVEYVRGGFQMHYRDLVRKELPLFSFP